MDSLSRSDLLSPERIDPRSEGWLADNVFHPFANGTGLKQIYNNFAAEKAEPAYVAPAKTLSSDWVVQSTASAAGAVLTYAIAGRLTGIGLSAAGSKLGMEGAMARVISSEHTAQILGAGLFDFAKAPNKGETRLGNAGASMAAFSIFAGGNHLISNSRYLAESSIKQGLGRIGVGAAGGLVGLETANFVSAQLGVKNEIDFSQRMDAIIHGGFINLVMPPFQRSLSSMLEGVKSKTPADTPGGAKKSESKRAPVEREAERMSETESAGKPGKGIVRATEDYEAWMAKQAKVVPSDLAAKHIEMDKGPFPFLRGTYYRWAENFPRLLPQLQEAPKVNSVGDLHVDNFGTWTNKNGRPVWGVNDFDEAAKLPYTNDLVRLLSSAKLLKDDGQLKIGIKDAADAVLEGYKQGLKDGGAPFLLDRNPELAKIASGQMQESGKFWHKLKKQLQPLSESEVPGSAKDALKSIMPNPEGPLLYGQRRAGVGSLGRERFVAIGQNAGADFAAEAKAVLPPATDFVAGKTGGASNYSEVMQHAVREADPYVSVKPDWVVRSLAPNRAKVELGELTHLKDERILLYSMGYETANIHLGTRNAAVDILADLNKRDNAWLADAVKTMTENIKEEQSDWKRKHAVE